MYMKSRISANILTAQEKLFLKKIHTLQLKKIILKTIWLAAPRLSEIETSFLD